ncbi:MAG TPA: hypothetical protein VGQ28_03150, partial [Thermoanaerobaculia bacterium]|nr:hypothetical protein [Thermoanaerobaculia bacterium]
MERHGRRRVESQLPYDWQTKFLNLLNATVPASSERPASAGLPVASVRARWLLAGLLAWAFGLRLWFASKGLDEGRFPDESFILDNVASFLTQGSLRPVHLHYPALGNLLHSLLLGAADV